MHSSSPEPSAQLSASLESAAPIAPGSANRPTPRSRDKTVHTIQGWRRWALWPLTTLFSLWGRSVRLDLSASSIELLRDHPHAIIILLWHNRLFLAAEIFRRFRRHRPLHALISASRDGAWLTDFFAIVGIQAVRGSSSRRGREAFLALVEEIRAGHDLGITPDGPRGPCYDFKNGGVAVARLTGAPIVLVGLAYESAWQLRSWDRFIVPKPFSRTRCYVRLAALPEGQTDEELAAFLRGKLLAISPEIDAAKAPII